MGVEAFSCPTATYTSDRSQEMILPKANAISNQLFFFNVNGMGVGGNGRSIFRKGEIFKSLGLLELHKKICR
jgi:hypothetical protein